MGNVLLFVANMFFVFVVSGIAGFIPLAFTGLSWSVYLGTFAATTSLQLFIGKLWAMHVERATAVAMEELSTKQKFIESVQYVDIQCAHCAQTNRIKILLNKDNSYTCTSCKQQNSVLIEMSTARKTVPLNDVSKGIFESIEKNSIEEKEI